MPLRMEMGHLAQKRPLALNYVDDPERGRPKAVDNVPGSKPAVEPKLLSLEIHVIRLLLTGYILFFALDSNLGHRSNHDGHAFHFHVG